MNPAPTSVCHHQHDIEELTSRSPEEIRRTVGDCTRCLGLVRDHASQAHLLRGLTGEDHKAPDLWPRLREKVRALRGSR